MFYVYSSIAFISCRYDPVKKILYGVAATAHEINEISEISLVGVKSDTGKVTMEFKKKSQTVPVCLVVE